MHRYSNMSRSQGNVGYPLILQLCLLLVLVLIVTAHDANLLEENGGKIKLTNDRAKNVLKRRGFAKRKACSKAKVDPEHFENLKEIFLWEIKSIVTIDEIPDELILNFD